MVLLLIPSTQHNYNRMTESNRTRPQKDKETCGISALLSFFACGFPALFILRLWLFQLSPFFALGFPALFILWEAGGGEDINPTYTPTRMTQFNEAPPDIGDFKNNRRTPGSMGVALQQSSMQHPPSYRI
eukprot:854653-Amphidinium_carterae.1